MDSIKEEKGIVMFYTGWLQKKFPMYESKITLFTETEWNFSLKYFEVWTQESCEKQQINSNKYGYSDNILNSHTFFFFFEYDLCSEKS